jgi:hypothetical protein
MRQKPLKGGYFLVFLLERTDIPMFFDPFLPDFRENMVKTPLKHSILSEIV